MAVDVDTPMDLLEIIKDGSVETLLSKIQLVAKILPYVRAFFSVQLMPFCAVVNPNCAVVTD